MDEIKARIDELAQMMQEFGLEEAKLSGDGWLIEFSRNVPSSHSLPVGPSVLNPGVQAPIQPKIAHKVPLPNKSVPKGEPVETPITGIFYDTPSPDAPTFVKAGDRVSEGQVIGLVEAMKVFNEIVAPKSGTASDYMKKNGDLVEPGDALIYID